VIGNEFRDGLSQRGEIGVPPLHHQCLELVTLLGPCAVVVNHHRCVIPIRDLGEEWYVEWRCVSCKH